MSNKHKRRHGQSTFDSFQYQLFARIRGLMPCEPKKVSLKVEGKTIKNKVGKIINEYNFNAVFKPENNNKQCFKRIVMPMIGNIMKGFNSILIIYGESGSGKTFTMFGKQKLNIIGILPMCLQYLFEQKSIIKLQLSSIEIFGHNINKIYLYDLFDPHNHNEHWSMKKGVKTIDNKYITKVDIKDIQDIYNKVIYAHNASHFAATGKNTKSSRGHITFIITVHQQITPHQINVSHFIMVDCGGCNGESAFNSEFTERVSRETLLCRRLEVGTINIGLSQIHTICKKLKKYGKISNNVGNGLRYILHPFINTKTYLSLLFTLSPSVNNANANESTLRFIVTSGIGKIKSIVTKENKTYFKTLINELRQHIDKQQEVIDLNKRQIENNMRMQNRLKLEINNKRTVKSVDKTDDDSKLIINDDGEEEEYYIDIDIKENELSDTVQEILNNLTDDEQQFIKLLGIDFLNEMDKELMIILMENGETLKLAIQQYAKLTIPWKKEQLLVKTKRDLTKKKKRSEEEKQKKDKKAGSIESYEEFVKYQQEWYMLQRDELIEHAIILNVMLAEEEMMTKALRQSKEYIVDYLKPDDWSVLVSFFKMKGFSYCSSYSASYSSSKTIGLSIGGAMDVNNFRECINKNIMPTISSITYNGILNEYNFDTMTRKYEEKNNNDYDDESMLFYPTYCYAKTNKLIFDKVNGTDNHNNNKEREYYMTVGLNSNIKQSEFKRKHLNLVILCDVSGSMNSSFDGDNKSVNIDINGEWRNTLKINDKIMVNDSGSWCNAEVINTAKNNDAVKIHYTGYRTMYDKWKSIRSDKLAPFGSINTKIECAKKAIKSILKQLTNKDRLGIVTFYNNANIVHKLEFMEDINIINTKIENMTASGGTNFGKGYKKSIEIYQELFNDDKYKLNVKDNYNEYDNRIIVLTDAVINEGISKTNDTLKMIEKYAENEYNIYTSFIGVGLDFNSSLIHNISTTRGCNYYSVKTEKDFDDKMNEEFDNMVTPLVFNVCLKIKCEGNSCQIDKVYGTDGNKANDIISNGQITKINTLFPSKKSKETGDTKGGIQLIKLKKTNNCDNINVELEVTFQDRNGKRYKNIQNVTFNPPKEKENNDMIEIDEKESDFLNINFYDNLGIRKAILLCKYVDLIKKWIEMDRNQYKLNMSKENKKIFTHFIEYFKKEMKECNDDKLQKEVDIMQKLINL